MSCFYFDSIGVPSPEARERDYGGGERWQAHATTVRVSRLQALDDDVRVAILDGQTGPSFVFDAARAAASSRLHVVLLDCSPDVRAQRLCGPRGQPELANEQMTNWAAYLRGQADALRLPIVDTSRLSIAEVADEMESFVRSLSH